MRSTVHKATPMSLLFIIALFIDSLFRSITSPIEGTTCIVARPPISINCGAEKREAGRQGRYSFLFLDPFVIMPRLSLSPIDSHV